MKARSCVEAARRDDGFTLTELLVAMSVMAVVMIMVTGAILLASGTSARVDATATAQTQVSLAFTTLDRQVRWASAVSTPGTVGGNDYVEFVTPGSTVARCNQLRFNRVTSQLQERTWPQGTTTFSAWKPLASGVSAVSFTVPAPAGASLARLTVSATATGGGAKGRVAATTAVTFTALNSAATSSASSVCGEGRTSP